VRTLASPGFARPGKDARQRALRDAESLPTYEIERLSKKTHVQRLIKLGRLLTVDKIDPAALAATRKFVLDQLEA
jgi:hypothetical protein